MGSSSSSSSSSSFKVEAMATPAPAKIQGIVPGVPAVGGGTNASKKTSKSTVKKKGSLLRTGARRQSEERRSTNPLGADLDTNPLVSKADLLNEYDNGGGAESISTLLKRPAARSAARVPSGQFDGDLGLDVGEGPGDENEADEEEKQEVDLAAQAAVKRSADEIAGGATKQPDGRLKKKKGE